MLSLGAGPWNPGLAAQTTSIRHKSRQYLSVNEQTDSGPSRFPKMRFPVSGDQLVTTPLKESLQAHSENIPQTGWGEAGSTNAITSLVCFLLLY